jgi:hypothetical protein
MLLNACFRWVALPPWDGVLQKYVPRTAQGPLELIHQGFADQIAIYIAIVVTAHAYQYFERLRKEEMEKHDFQRALAASELQALKVQLHPHVLFNTLHGISTLIDTDRASAKAPVIKLLRYALEHGSSDLIPLADELKFIGEYLELEKMRLGPRISVAWSIDPKTERTLVPQSILQAPWKMRFDTELPVPEEEAGWRSRLEGTAIALIFVFATACAASVQREWGSV